MPQGEMMRAILAALGFMISVAAAQAQWPEDLVATKGLQTCAAWLSTPANEHDGESWLLGFWSGINHPIPKMNIGPHSNVDEMIVEMKRSCKAQPSSTLIGAALKIVELSQLGVFTDPPRKP
jgi:hypothetical protein